MIRETASEAIVFGQVPVAGLDRDRPACCALPFDADDRLAVLGALDPLRDSLAAAAEDLAVSGRVPVRVALDRVALGGKVACTASAFRVFLWETKWMFSTTP